MQLKKVVLFFVIVLIVSCRSGPVLDYDNDDRATGLAFYYGRDFFMEALRPDREELEDIKSDLLSSVADRNPALQEAESEWTAIQYLDTSDGFYLLFELRPRSRIPLVFLDLKFKLNGYTPVAVRSYYAVDARIGSGTVVSLGFGLGHHPYHGGGFYPMYAGSTGRNVQWDHAYRWLLLFDGELVNSQDYTLEVTAHNGKTILLK